MKLIIDANILMSALIAIKGKTYDLIFDDNIQLYAPEFLTIEIKKHEKEILAKTGLSKPDFELFLSLLRPRINFVSANKFKQLIPKAEKITPDINDTEYIALAIAMKCAIWSNDKKLKEQKTIKIYNTKELIQVKF
ncbi:hypothetical protein JW851_05035 [Candidatus Woesearchaeota archaeon]|nr:hypothetical protein [Candidatus Woesearchaeota archaeon]